MQDPCKFLQVAAKSHQYDGAQTPLKCGEAYMQGRRTQSQPLIRGSQVASCGCVIVAAACGLLASDRQPENGKKQHQTEGRGKASKGGQGQPAAQAREMGKESSSTTAKLFSICVDSVADRIGATFEAFAGAHKARPTPVRCRSSMIQRSPHRSVRPDSSNRSTEQEAAAAHVPQHLGYAWSVSAG